MRARLTFAMLAALGAASGADVPYLIHDHGAVRGSAGSLTVTGSIGGLIITDLGVGTGTFSTSGTPPVTLRPGNAVVIDRSVALPPTLDVPLALEVQEDHDLEFAVSAADANTGAALDVVFAAPTHGTVTDLGGGRARYRPASFYVGIDHVSVATTDPTTGDQVSGTVTITVVPVGHAPVNTLRPIVSGLSSPGEALVGQTLTAHVGTWNDDLDGGTATITVLRVWQRRTGGSFADTTGTGTTYLLHGDDAEATLRVKETATGSDDGLSSVAYSDPITIRRVVPDFPPTTGTPAFPGALTATIGLPFAYALPLATGVVATVSGLPAGLAYDAANQRITGIPIGPATHADVAITVGAATSHIALTVQASAPALQVAGGLVPVSSYRLPDLTVGVPMRFQLPALSSSGGYDSSGLPPGVALDPTTGVLSGIPTATGAYSVGVSIAAAGGAVVQTVFSIAVHAASGTAPTIASAASPALTGGSGFSYRVPTAGAAAVTVEGLPSGLTFDAATGVISGILPDLTVPVAIPLRITAEGPDGQRTSSGMVLDIAPADPADPRLGSLPAQQTAVGQPLQVVLPVIGDLTAIVIDATGLPPGMGFDAATLRITGRATASGWWQVVITARRVTGSASRTTSTVVSRTTVAIEVTDQDADGGDGYSPWVRFRNNLENGFSGPGEGSCGHGGGVAMIIAAGLALAFRRRR